jgi:tetratricopeptide (TPR) repeat protein
MKTRPGWFACFLCILVALSVLPSAYADAPAWVEVRSPHFSVATDAGEKRGREVALRFEQMRAVFGALMVKANVNIPIPLQIVAFRNTKEFRQFAPLWHGKPTQLAGLFQGGEDRSFIMLDMSVENPWTVVFHEYAHQLMNGMLQKQLPPWFEEGFAEYFSSIEVDNKEARVGRIPEQTHEIVQQNVMKIADLFKVRQNSQTYNESGDRRTVFYAESSMLVHYLYDNQLIPTLSVYFDLVTNKNVPVEDAIQQAFGMSAAQFDKVLEKYMRGSTFKYYALPKPANIADTGYTATSLSLADSNAILADIHLHSHDYQDKAIAEFQEILKTDPSNAASCRGLGYAYLQKQDYKQAADYFRRAAQADSKDPRVHYYSALLMSREGGFSNQSDLPVMTKELETAIALDPKFADPYMLLGFAQAYGGDPAKGLETMQKAISLNPRNTTYQFNLAQMYMNNREFDQALDLLHALEKTQDQQLALRVSEAIRQAQQIKDMLQAANRPERSEATDSARDARTTETPTLTLRRSARSDQPNHDSPQPETARPETPKPEATRPEPPKAPVPVRFLQGVLKAVDCSTPPAAVLTVISGTKTWKMNITDTNHLVLFGADKFSCSWNKQRVAVNYRDAGNAEGSVVSIEIK